MLKNKIDEYVRDFTTAERKLTLTKSELRAAFEDIVREAVGEMRGGHSLFFNDEMRGGDDYTTGFEQCYREQQAKAEEILNQLK